MSPHFDRLRALLEAQLPPAFAVSAEGTQYRFGEESAAYAELDVRRGDAFVVVAVYGAVEDGEFIARVWLHRAREVWFVDPSDQTVTRVLRDGTLAVAGTAQTLTSANLPGVAIPIASIFLSS